MYIERAAGYAFLTAVRGNTCARHEKAGRIILVIIRA